MDEDAKTGPLPLPAAGPVFVQNTVLQISVSVLYCNIFFKESELTMKRYSGPLMLVLTAMIWGAGFVAQSVGMDYVGPFTFNSVRSILGGVFLIPCIALLRKLGYKKAPGTRKDLIVGGVVCGAILAVASSLQQIGVAYTTVSKAGFITALYVIIVPLLDLFIHRKVAPLVWGCAVLSAIGLYLLCMSGPASINKGDILVLLCAITFSLHILAIDHFAPLAGGVELSCVQFLVSGLLCAVPMLLFETPAPAAILSAWQPIVYAGILSCGVGYTLQAVAQNRTDPTVASLIMCMESVFSAVFGWILLSQALSLREISGCALMFAASLLAQFAGKLKAPKKPLKQG